MKANNYEEAKAYFINNAHYGWKYIDCFVMNEKLYKAIKHDQSIKLGSRIELEEGIKNRTEYPRIKSTLNGYGIILINPNSEEYFIEYIKYNSSINESLTQLLHYNISKDYQEE